MILSFKKEFKQPILDGTKIHSIREDRYNRWKEGMIIHMATGLRTKDYKQFHEGICKSIQQIEIIRVSDYWNETIVRIDGRQLDLTEIQKLAWNDGFTNLIHFWMWFNRGFVGKIIHWTDFKY